MYSCFLRNISTLRTENLVAEIDLTLVIMLLNIFTLIPKSLYEGQFVLKVKSLNKYNLVNHLVKYYAVFYCFSTTY